MSGLGITAGAHRLWAHRSYKGKLPLRIILMIFNTIAFEVSKKVLNIIVLGRKVKVNKIIQDSNKLKSEGRYKILFVNIQPFY